MIEGKEGEIGIDLNRDEDLPFKRDGDMAMLVWLENGGNRLLPRSLQWRQRETVIRKRIVIGSILNIT